MHLYTLQYRFNGESRTYALELQQPELLPHEAAMHLLQLHYGDAENSLFMPTAEATPGQILEQAETAGLTQISVTPP